MKIDERAGIGFHSEGKRKDYTTADSVEFVKNGIQKDLEYIRLNLDSDLLDIRIYLSLKWSNREFEVTGTDSTLVAGIAARLEDIFEKYKLSINDLFHRSSTSIPIFVAISAVPSIAALFWLQLTADPAPYSTWLLAMALAMFFGSTSLTRWLYPGLETKKMTRVKARRAILAAIGLILGGIVTNYIWRATE